MDPYLEQHWRDVHQSLVIYARDAIQGQLPGDLIARVEERVFVDAPESSRSVYPDVRVVETGGRESAAASTALAGVAVPLVVVVDDEPVSEGYIEILEIGSGNRVITMIEVVSPTNKTAGEGRRLYRKKQRECRRAKVSLVEIDLIRAGRWVLAIPKDLIPLSHRSQYQVCIRRGWRANAFEVYKVPLREKLPTIQVPLRRSDPDVKVDLQGIFDQAYRNGRYDTLDYAADPNPPLKSADAAWANELLKAAGHR